MGGLELDFLLLKFYAGPLNMGERERDRSWIKPGNCVTFFSTREPFFPEIT